MQQPNGQMKLRSNEERLVFAISIGGEVIAQDELVVMDVKAVFFAFDRATSGLSVRRFFAVFSSFFNLQDSVNLLSSLVNNSLRGVLRTSFLLSSSFLKLSGIDSIQNSTY